MTLIYGARGFWSVPKKCAYTAGISTADKSGGTTQKSGLYPSKHRQKPPVQTSAAWHTYWLPCQPYCLMGRRDIKFCTELYKIIPAGFREWLAEILCHRALYHSYSAHHLRSIWCFSHLAFLLPFGPHPHPSIHPSIRIRICFPWRGFYPSDSLSPSFNFTAAW